MFFKGQMSLLRKLHTAAVVELCCRIPLADGVRISEYLHTHILRKGIQIRIQYFNFPEILIYDPLKVRGR